VEKRKKNNAAGGGGAGAYPLPSVNKACCPEKEECGPGKGLLWRSGRRIMLLLLVVVVLVLLLIPFRP
jgi:hypothetical protein